MNERKRIVWCDCGDAAHHLIFEKSDWEHGPPELLLYYRLDHYAPFWKRLLNAFLYVTKKDLNRIHYHDIVISDTSKLKELRDLIDDVIEEDSDGR